MGMWRIVILIFLLLFWQFLVLCIAVWQWRACSTQEYSHTRTHIHPHEVKHTHARIHNRHRDKQHCKIQVSQKQNMHILSTDTPSPLPPPPLTLHRMVFLVLCRFLKQTTTKHPVVSCTPTAAVFHFNNSQCAAIHNSMLVMRYKQYAIYLVDGKPYRTVTTYQVHLQKAARAATAALLAPSVVDQKLERSASIQGNIISNGRRKQGLKESFLVLAKRRVETTHGTSS